VVRRQGESSCAGSGRFAVHRRAARRGEARLLAAAGAACGQAFVIIPHVRERACEEEEERAGVWRVVLCAGPTATFLLWHRKCVRKEVWNQVGGAQRPFFHRLRHPVRRLSVRALRDRVCVLLYMQRARTRVCEPRLLDAERWQVPVQSRASPHAAHCEGQRAFCEASWRASRLLAPPK
jgi:hypothetical protein